MKKSQIYLIIALMLIIASFAIYLNRNYAHFYSFLAQKSLLSPIHPAPIILTNQSSTMQAKTIKYLALGDSLTAGVGVLNIESSFPFLIAQKLSLKNNVILVNPARSGDTTDDVIANQLPKVLSEKPDVITLLIGINDLHNLKSEKEFEQNLTYIATILKQSKAQVYLFSLPYLGSEKIVYFPYNLVLDSKTKQFNKIIKQVASDFDLTYIDLYLLEKSENFYSTDEFHPSEEGYKEWVKSINVN